MKEFHSAKLAKTFSVDNEYQEKRMQQLEKEKSVESWALNTEHSFSYTYKFEIKTVTPDLIVKRKNGVFLENVTPLGLTQDESFICAAAGVSFCEDREMIFKYIYKNEIWGEPTKQKIIFLEGPDNCGKSHVGRFMSQVTTIPYFRFSRQHDMWTKGQFKTALEFDQPVLAALFHDTKYNCIVDRSFASEFVYSRVFGRETNMQVLEDLDEKYASMGAVFVILLRKDYSNNGGDIVVPDDKLLKLHHEYLNFVEWTKCSCIIMHVDEFDNDLCKQVPRIIDSVNKTLKIGMKSITEIKNEK